MTAHVSKSVVWILYFKLTISIVHGQCWPSTHLIRALANSIEVVENEIHINIYSFLKKCGAAKATAGKSSKTLVLMLNYHTSSEGGR